MKKTVILAMAIVASMLVNAAATNWKLGAGNIYGPDGETKYTGDVILYAVGLDTWSQAVTVNNGVASTAVFSADVFTANTAYDFYFTIEDGGKKFTSPTKTGVTALATGTATIQFGNMQSATQNAGNWAAVPEPTSGLLLLLGMAGLALKRKRA